MKTPHKHAELIKAWADGAEIQIYSRVRNEWVTYTEGELISWLEIFEYRIKPETKPDLVVDRCIAVYGSTVLWTDSPNCRFTFDGETGKLKKAEVL